jgi:tRNA threonylcarbamoyladenosine biosynthesis protein TsaB
VLALDTTARAGSAALVLDEQIVDERAGDGTRTHALRMPGEIVAIAAANDWPLSAIDLYAVASGPGSFTGLRIGIATIQALAYVHRRRVVAVPVLDALAYAASVDLAEGSVVATWTDAHRGDVFTALYRIAAGPRFSRDRVTAIEGPTVSTPAVAIARWRALDIAMPTIVTGDGAMLHAHLLEQHVPRGIVIATPLLAGVIGLVAVDRAGDAVEPSQVRPLYVRRPDAEVTRDEKLRMIETQSKDT